jgi:hypothetical protein
MRCHPSKQHFKSAVVAKLSQQRPKQLFMHRLSDDINKTPVTQTPITQTPITQTPIPQTAIVAVVVVAVGLVSIIVVVVVVVVVLVLVIVVVVVVVVLVVVPLVAVDDDDKVCVVRFVVVPSCKQMSKRAFVSVCACECVNARRDHQELSMTNETSVLSCAMEAQTNVVSSLGMPLVM